MKFLFKIDITSASAWVMKKTVVWWPISLTRNYQFEFDSEFETEF